MKHRTVCLNIFVIHNTYHIHTHTHTHTQKLRECEKEWNTHTHNVIHVHKEWWKELQLKFFNQATQETCEERTPFTQAVRVLTRNSRSKTTQIRVCSAWILELSRLSLFHRIFFLFSFSLSLSLSHPCTWTHFHLIPFALLVCLPPNVSSITTLWESDVAFNYSLSDSLNFLLLVKPFIDCTFYFHLYI